MNAEMDVSKNQWRSTGGKVPFSTLSYILTKMNDFENFISFIRMVFALTCNPGVQ